MHKPGVSIDGVACADYRARRCGPSWIAESGLLGEAVNAPNETTDFHCVQRNARGAADAAPRPRKVQSFGPPATIGIVGGGSELPMAVCLPS